MKSVMLSIQPKWCELIANGKKAIEVRKTRPKLETPFKCYIYETKSANDVHGFSILGRYRLGKVIGEFVCDSIRKGRADNLVQAYYHNNPSETCLTDQELALYANDGQPLYFWHISDLKIYDNPKELGEFKQKVKKCTNGVYYSVKKPLTHPPQSWYYVEKLL